MNSDNYLVIQGFMVKELNLKSSELLVYALIYGFSQDDESIFKGSRKYIAEWFNCSLPTIDKALQGLLEKNYIIKEIEEINGVIFNRYKYNKETLQGIKKLYRGSKETLQGYKETLQGIKKLYRGSKETLQGYKETLHNNNIYKYKDNNNIKEKEYKKKSLEKPTIEEIQNYCDERNNGINANAFYDFYESKNWYVGKNKMKDWKACVRTWEQRNKTKKEKVDDIFDKLKKEGKL